MTRYRDMTNEELISWAMGFDCREPAAAKLIYALTKRLEQAPPPAPPEPAPQPRERARTIEAVIRLGRLSREARAWLSEQGRPHWPAGTTSATSCHTLHGPSCTMRHRITPHWSDCQLGHWPTATRGY